MKIIVIEGLEGAGKTTLCNALCKYLSRSANVSFVKKSYDKTGMSGPGIALLTESPSVSLSNHTLFFLYLARLAGKIDVIQEDSSSDYILVDRLHLSLYYRAKILFGIDEALIKYSIDHMMDMIQENIHVINLICSYELGKKRKKGNELRRREFIDFDLSKKYWNEYIYSTKEIPTINTSHKTPFEVYKTALKLINIDGFA